MDLQYSSSLNGASFLLFELKQVIKLKKEGLLNTEIRKKVIEDNIFQVANKNRINRSLPSVMKRADVIDEILAKHMMEGSLEDSKLINLYAIMKTDLLFFEFMREVISEKLQNNNLSLEKKDINIFFTVKSEQNEQVRNWSDINIEKLKRAYMQVLFESGLLKERKSNELTRLLIDDQLKEHLKNIGDSKYLQAMGE